MFFGETAINLDAKGRMALPTRYRESVEEASGNRLVLTYSAFDSGCLWLYPEPEWERVIEERPDLIDAKGFPHNVTCDRSGMSPIIGIRYNLIGHDYDLCEAEFEKLSADLKPLYRAIHPVAFYRKALSHM